MKNLLCALVIAFPLCAGLGYQQIGDLSVSVMKGCGTYNPMLGDTKPSNPACAFVSLSTARPEVTSFVVTITYFDSEGEHQAQLHLVDRDGNYSTTLFSGLAGTELLTVEVEQCSDSGCFDWYQFQLN